MQPSTNANKNLLVVLNVGDEDAICEYFSPYWKLAGYDLAFSSPTDKPSKLGPFCCGLSYNRDVPSQWNRYQRRVLETMKLCLDTDYQAFCFTQYDSVCFGTLPVPDDNICLTHVCGGSIEGLGRFFVHPPWMFGRSALAAFVQEAMNNSLDLCRGVMDFWMAAILDKAQIPIIDSGATWKISWVDGQIQFTPQNNGSKAFSWTHNAIDTEWKIESARKFYHAGGLFLHGVKNPETLRRIVQCESTKAQSTATNVPKEKDN